MLQSKLTEKFQITIPLDVRKFLDLHKEAVNAQQVVSSHDEKYVVAGEPRPNVTLDSQVLGYSTTHASRKLFIAFTVRDHYNATELRTEVM